MTHAYRPHFARRWWLTLTIALAAVVGLAACTNVTPGTGATTQPGVTTGELMALALTDYDALVASGVIKETPEVVAAVKVLYQAQADYAAGKSPIIVVNNAGLALAEALSKAKK